MDPTDFIAWSLDPARTVEERYTVELLVEHGVNHWNIQRKIYEGGSTEERLARSRERKLNPAYEPHYSENGLRKAAEFLPTMKEWHCHSGRPIRNLEPFRVCTALESLSLSFDEPADVSPLASLPKLRKVALGYPGSLFSNKSCTDFTPLARCTELRDLSLCFQVRWPDLTGLTALAKLEALTLSGNLLAMPPGAVFPGVRRAMLYCLPLAVRSVADLPSLPDCEFLTLCGADRLDGIERMPRLRNLHVLGPFESFAPLAALTSLTCLSVIPYGNPPYEGQPRDVSPLAAMPALRCLKFGPPHVGPDMPRDYFPLAEAPALRELTVLHCPPVEMEVMAITAGLPPWDDVFLASEPRALPPLRMIVAPQDKTPRAPDVILDPEEGDLPDAGLRECEGRWVGRHVQAFVSRRIGYEEWGTAEAQATSRTLGVIVESFDVVERLPEIIEATRHAIAGLRGEYTARLMIALKAKPPEPTPAQKQLEEQFQAARDQWEYEQRKRDQEQYLERLHQMELKKQQGLPIEAEEFSPEETAPYPKPPWELGDEERDDNADEYDDESGGGTAIKRPPDPPPSFLDDEHPLADNYRLLAWVTLGEVWYMPHHRGIAVHLMGREPDLDIPEEAGNNG